MSENWEKFLFQNALKLKLLFIMQKGLPKQHLFYEKDLLMKQKFWLFEIAEVQK